MTENEAQKWLERFEWDDSEETSEALATICEALQEYPKFKAIGTVEEFKELKEKNELKKPITYTDTNKVDYCFKCHKTVKVSHTLDGSFCAVCGYTLDNDW